ncbi:putative C2 domain-containing protein [Helianthus debilis subsp. tardiflorus]
MGGETSLELTIISAKDLYNVNIFAKMNVYAVVYITGNQDQKQKTHADEDGDSNPTWNHRMKFTIDESAALQNRLTLVVKIKAVGMFGDKDVGEVHVPVKELLDGDYTGTRPLQFVCYQPAPGYGGYTPQPGYWEERRAAC